MEIKKVNVPFWIKIDTDWDCFGHSDRFLADYFDETGTISEIPSGAYDEIIRDTSGKTATVSALAEVGSKEIKVNSGFTLEDGDVFKIPSGEMYYIESIENNTLTLRQSLTENVNVGNLLVEVGNTGIFRIQVTFDTPGEYTIILRSPKYGMQNYPLTVQVVEDDFADMNEKLNQLIETSTKKHKIFI